MNQAESIRRTRETPLIGLVGSAFPSDDYKSDQGIEVGYAIRKYLEGRNGSVFTGGVDGVGADAYCGVVRFCIETWLNTHKQPKDRFFVLVPEHASDQAGFLQQYEPPPVYSLLARLLEQRLEVVRAGYDMGERRKCLAQVADMLVVVNGSEGTLDEVVHALEHSKPVITLSESGGVARILSNLRQNTNSPRDARVLRKAGFSDGLNINLIHCARDTSEIIQFLTAMYL